MKGLVQLDCLKTAALRLGFSVKEFDPHGNLLVITKSDCRLVFANFALPFNSGSVEQVCKDKEFAYFLLKDVLRLPKTLGFFDPNFSRAGYDEYKKFQDVRSIVKDIEKNFTFPVVVKRNSGMRGINVHLCQNALEVETALSTIFSKDSPDYDYVALAQSYIKPKAEYRAIVFKGKIVLLYEKEISQAEFVGNLSPLHFEGAKAVMIKDEKIFKDIEGYLAPIFLVLRLEFAGFDIILDEKGQWHLIEINTRPGLAYFIRDNGKEPIIKMYETIIGQ